MPQAIRFSEVVSVEELPPMLRFPFLSYVLNRAPGVRTRLGPSLEALERLRSERERDQLIQGTAVVLETVLPEVAEVCVSRARECLRQCDLPPATYDEAMETLRTAERCLRGRQYLLAIRHSTRAESRVNRKAPRPQ